MNGILLSYSDADFIANTIRKFAKEVVDSMDSGKDLADKMMELGKTLNVSEKDIHAIQDSWEKSVESRKAQLEPVNKCLELLMCGSDEKTNKNSYDVFDITTEKKHLSNIKSLDEILKIFSALREQKISGYKRLLFEDSNKESFEIGKML